MADVTLTYKGATIAELSESGSKTIRTAGKFCEGDISVEYVKPSGGGCSIANIIDGTFPSGHIVSEALVMPDWAISFKNVKQPWSLLSKATQVGNSAVRANKNLTSLVFPNLRTAGTSGGFVFAENKTTFYAIDLGNVSTIQPNTFFNCNALNIIILRSDAIVTLANVNGIANGTPFKSGGDGGTIYIKKSLYDHLGDGTAQDYQAATNWATVHGYGTITWAQIEGSIYETQYADGTPIPTE